MSMTVSFGELFLGAAAIALLFAAAHALIGGVIAQMRARAETDRALAALYTEMTLNTRALELWSFDAARARRDGDNGAFAPRRAVFQSLGTQLHALPKPALEKALDFYALLDSLERRTIEAVDHADAGGPLWRLRHSAEEAAHAGRAALFSFEIEGAVASVERPRADARPAEIRATAPELTLAKAA